MSNDGDWRLPVRRRATAAPSLSGGLTKPSSPRLSGSSQPTSARARRTPGRSSSWPTRSSRAENRPTPSGTFPSAESTAPRRGFSGSARTVRARFPTWRSAICTRRSGWESRVTLLCATPDRPWRSLFRNRAEELGPSPHRRQAGRNRDRSRPCVARDPHIGRRLRGSFGPSPARAGRRLLPNRRHGSEQAGEYGRPDLRSL